MRVRNYTITWLNKMTGKYDIIIIGDGAGVTRGLIQASASGVVAARQIKERNRQAASRQV